MYTLLYMILSDRAMDWWYWAGKTEGYNGSITIWTSGNEPVSEFYFLCIMCSMGERSVL